MRRSIIAAGLVLVLLALFVPGSNIASAQGRCSFSRKQAAKPLHGNTMLTCIQVFKFEDDDGDGVQDPGEPNEPGWTVFLDNANPNGVPDGAPAEPDGVTGSQPPDEGYTFGPLANGTYRVCEVQQAGYTNTFMSFPAASPGTCQTVQITTQPVEGFVTIPVVFGNQPPPCSRQSGQTCIQVLKYEDVNGNGQQNLRERPPTTMAGRCSSTIRTVRTLRTGFSTRVNNPGPQRVVLGSRS